MIKYDLISYISSVPKIHNYMQLLNIFIFIVTCIHNQYIYSKRKLIFILKLLITCQTCHQHVNTTIRVVGNNVIAAVIALQ